MTLTITPETEWLAKRAGINFTGLCDCYDGTGGSFSGATVNDVADAYFEHLERSHK